MNNLIQVERGCMICSINIWLRAVAVHFSTPLRLYQPYACATDTDGEGQKNGQKLTHQSGEEPVSALQLKRDIGVSYNTAWKMKHKLMQVMLEREKGKKLSGRIEIDDAYIGGGRPGKPGRGAAHKAPFIAVVETEGEEHRPQRMQLRTVSGFRSAEIERYAKMSLEVGSWSAMAWLVSKQWVTTHP